MTTTIKDLEKFSEENGHRLTDPRRYVFEIIACARKPIGAYDILAELAKKIDNPKPPTAYRAIDFLVEHGFVHKIESMNAFMLCHSDHSHEGSQFMICDDCGTVIETHMCHLPGPFQDRTDQESFHPKSWNLEIHGLCAACL